MQLKQRREAKAQQVRLENQNKQDLETPFRPSINKRELSDIRRAFTPTPQYLMNKGIETHIKLKEKRKEKRAKDMTECTFSPKINRRSRNKTYTNYTESLYKEAFARKFR